MPYQLKERRVKCYRVKVTPMLADSDRYVVSESGHYRYCRNGELYVMANSVEEAGRKIPQAVAVEEIGIGSE